MKNIRLFLFGVLFISSIIVVLILDQQETDVVRPAETVSRLATPAPYEPSRETLELLDKARPAASLPPLELPLLPETPVPTPKPTAKPTPSPTPEPEMDYSDYLDWPESYEELEWMLEMAYEAGWSDCMDEYGIEP